eukprot:4740888-Pyramimonas_sp.AAC.1
MGTWPKRPTGTCPRFGFQATLVRGTMPWPSFEDGRTEPICRWHQTRYRSEGVAPGMAAPELSAPIWWPGGQESTSFPGFLR